MFKMTPAFKEWVDGEIKEHLRAIVIVSDLTPYAYTISSRRFGMTEFIMVGTADAGVRRTLNDIARMMPPNPGRSLKLRLQAASKYGVKLVRVDPLEAFRLFPETEGMRAYHGAPPGMLYQVIVPDANGKHTGDDDVLFPNNLVTLIPPAA